MSDLLIPIRVADPSTLLDIDENDNTCEGKSAVETFMNNPRWRRLGQCRAKGMSTRSVSVDGEASFTGSEAKMKVSREGYWEGMFSIWDCVMSTG
jgi:hypothetical protein